MARSLLQDVEADGVDLVGSAANRRAFALFKAEWTTAYVNSLPDASFAYVEAGAAYDKSKRHLPYKDKDGKVDLPHLRNALARLDQTDIPAAAKATARAKLEAAAKQAGVGDQNQKSLDGGDAMKVQATKAAFRKHLEVLGVPDAAALTEAQLLEKATAAGYELVEKATPPEPAITTQQRSFLDRLMKFFSRAEPDPDDPLASLDKSKLPPEWQAAFQALADKTAATMRDLTTLAKARETEQRTALTKRAVALHKAGWLPDVQDEAALATMTEPEITALEKARDRVTERLKKAGVLESFGAPAGAEDKATSLKELVFKAVVQQLGREPIDKGEEVRTRMLIYKANPGLAAAVRAEEKQEKLAGAIAE